MNAGTDTHFVVPELVISHLHLKPGDTVADFGAGPGHFLRELSRRVQEGKVYACEIQKALVEVVSDFAHKEGYTNIYPLWCDLEEKNGIPISDSQLDVGILANTLFQIEDKPAALLEMSRTIRSGGRFVLIDWSESFAGLGPTTDHVVEEKEATALLESLGFVLEQTFPAGAHHYGLVFRKQ